MLFEQMLRPVRCRSNSSTQLKFPKTMNTKIVAAENYMGSKLKRRERPLYDMSPEDWEYMCDKFTSHYTKSIEQ